MAEEVVLGVIFKYFAGFSNSIVYTEKLPDLIYELPETLIQKSFPLNCKQATLFPTVYEITEFCLKSNRLMTKLEAVQFMVVEGFLNSKITLSDEKETKVSMENLAIRILLTMLMFVAV
jgi:hypothetical protein